MSHRSRGNRSRGRGRGSSNRTSNNERSNRASNNERTNRPSNNERSNRASNNERNNNEHNDRPLNNVRRNRPSNNEHPRVTRVTRVIRDPLDVERENVRILSDNFNSSELSFKGSDNIVSISHEDEIQLIWKRLLKKRFENQHHIRRFLNSCLVVASKDEYGLEELITHLGDSDGRQRLREIVMFPASVDAGLKPRVASFQRVTLPFLALLTRSGITDSTLETHVNAIYTNVYANLDDFMHDKVMDMLETLVQRNSLADQETSQNDLLTDDSNSFIPTSLGQFFLVIVRLCTVFLNRIKDAGSNETMYNIAQRLENAKTTWQNSFLTQQENSNDPLYTNIERRDYFFHILDKELKSMKQMIKKSVKTFKNSNNTTASPSSISYQQRAQIVDLKRSYDPPGELSENGPRHDNDFSDISDISIIPTTKEILSDRPPFLPINIPGAPHFLPEGTARLLDSQFRLLREDMLNPIRGGIVNFLQFLADTKRNDAKIKKFTEVGGRYKNENKDSGDLCIYANARFVKITIDKRRGFSCRIAFTAPKNLRSKKDRISYWKKSSKKLMNGNLVCLLWPSEGTAQYSLFFGVIVQRDEEVLAKHEDRAEIDINFSDAAIYPLALNDTSNRKNRKPCFMVESTGIYLESYYHILKTLQSTRNSMLPFEKYLTLADLEDEDRVGIVKNASVVDMPDYARAPGFHFNLSVLLHNKQKQLFLNVANDYEHKYVIKALENGSMLDETQAKALVSSLCKEIALIEGPPGTGKSFVGVEIMKVLLAEENRRVKLSPILTICFTNHALDQFLEHLIDKAGIDNIVRLGGRSKSEKISPFNLEEIVRNREKPTGAESYLLAKAYESLEIIQKRVDKIQKKLNSKWLYWEEVSSYLSVEFFEHYNRFVRYQDDPEAPNFLLDDDLNEEWEMTGKHSKNNGNRTIFEKWCHGMDIDNAKSMIKAMNNPKQRHKEKKEGNRNSNRKHNSNRNAYSILANYDGHVEEYYKSEENDDFSEVSEDEVYDQFYGSMQQRFLLNWQEPKTNRPLEILKNDAYIWRMSKTERVTLHDFWKQDLNVECVEELAQLQKNHDEKRKEIEDIRSERRKKILKECDVIGMTTNGAAKFQSLIRSVQPKVILCEEAGEVLEAHILSALTPSTQHLILIGDHEQLRPNIATYNLRCDSRVGKKYSLDESLFERLVKGDRAARVEKIQLLTQRRMRSSEISDLIRNTLYKDLVDGENTTKYPNVRGVQHNVYFINHRRSEDKAKNEHAIQSHSNQYEVDMVVEMVNYFVRNGYTKQEDIAVLTPYLGQMMKLRDALKAKFTVVIDDRDSQELAEMEDENEDEDEKPESSVVRNISVATKKSLNQQVTLRTVDNFQGEEAKIVIISLVRNSWNEHNRGSIGFLKSTNRSNVLLSRARHGMYLIGNAELMANESPDMWAKVIQMLKSRNPPQVGDSFPIICPQHPSNKNNVKDPEQFAEFAPDGGCLESCGQNLVCGHLCPYKCHFDNPDHIDIYCRKPCTKLHSKCNHPCDKFCGQKCGDCTLVIGDIILPSCSHIYRNVKCCESHDIMSLRCRVKVSKTLPKCGHELEVMCYESVDSIVCKQQCGAANECGHICSAPCNECQKRSIKANNDVPPLDENGYIKRNKHVFCKKICERNLFCGHNCEDACHAGRNCKPCNARCTVSCSHSSCKLECFKPCTSCAEPCNWYCPHGKGRCLLSCGAPCSRLPCSLRCEKTLKCGHRCPGVCGEICPTPKFCDFCAPDNIKEQMIDFYEMKTFAEIDWGEERMIVLECGHVFTMETMDHHMEMNEYYEGDYENWTGVKMLSSQTGENKIKTCPNCRAPIKNIKRYGRSIKKRILDTQNKKFLTKYDLHLKYQRDVLGTNIRKMENNRPKLLEKFKNNRIYSINNSKKDEDKNFVEQNKDVPEVATSEQYYQIEKYSLIPEFHAKLWKNHVRELLNSYQQLIMIMSDSKNPPYKKAFEAAVTRLYNEKSKIQMDSLISNLENLHVIEEAESPQNQKDRFEQSLREVGLIAPQFDRRVYLDAFFEIVNIQKTMFHEVTLIVSELPKVDLSHGVDRGTSILETRRNWIKFCQNIIDSIKKHLKTICQICKESKYGRHLVLASMELVEIKYRACRFTLNNPLTVMNDSIKKKIIRKCDRIRKDCRKILIDTLPKVELEYFQGQCKIKISKLLNDVDELQVAAEKSGKLTKEEKLEIFRAMSSEFIGSGHWYECPNGHPYTIGECGGAMQLSRCPDCGVSIGGGAHALTQGNRRNVEFETINGGNSASARFW